MFAGPTVQQVLPASSGSDQPPHRDRRASIPNAGRDPRWRVIVSIAFQMDLDHEPAPEPARRTTTRRHRSAGYFSNVLADALI